MFKLSQLSRMYATRLQEMGVQISNRLHSPQLKEIVLIYCPDLKEFCDGLNILLVFSYDGADYLICIKQY